MRILRETLHVPLNLGMACTEEMVEIACGLKPDYVCLVPEKREEVTTEGGLDIVAARNTLEAAIPRLHAAGIKVSLFIDAEHDQIRCARELHAEMVELHTGQYAETFRRGPEALGRLEHGLRLGLDLGLVVNAGHGLTYWNVGPVARLPGMNELNIGHSIVSRAVLVGIERAVREMREAMASQNG